MKATAVLECKRCKRWFMTKTRTKRCPYCGVKNEIGKQPTKWFNDAKDAQSVVAALNRDREGSHEDTTSADRLLRSL